MSEDNSWVFDSLVCFLHGPIWNAPLQTFIEEKSLIFDPNEKIDNTNPEFTKIHDEYKNLVDFMLGSFMEELQITPEQFEIACLEGRHNQSGSSNAFSFHQGLFQQIWAANDIRIFVRMMTQRNVEIQLQALDLIERRQNSTEIENDSTTMIVSNSNIGGIVEQGSSSSIGSGEDVLQKIAEEDILTDRVDPLELFENDKLGDLKSNDDENVDDKFKRLNLFFDKERINSADVKARQEYLKTQRDKILEIKKKARTRQLNETVKKNGRPSSAQVAQKLMQGDTEVVTEQPPEASMLLRKTLAKRLRSEVVNPDDK